MKKPLFKLAAYGVLSALALTGCGNDDDHSDPSQAPKTAVNYIFATDHGGHVNIAAHNSDHSVSNIAAFQPLNSTGGNLTLGEIHIAHNKAFVIIQSGLTNEAGEFTGGGLGIVNLQTMALEHIQSMPTTLTTADDGSSPTTTRFVHTYMDPDGIHLWMNNDGVSTTAVDSVFRINIEPADAAYLAYDEIVVGHGHKKSAFAYPVAGGAQALNLFATHNLQQESISIIDNDPLSTTFLEVLATVNLNNGLPFQNTTHGMGFSSVSGHIYTGVTPGVDIGLSIIDATDAALPHSTIQAGMDMSLNQIPAAGYVKVSHDGRWVMTAGYKNEAGYLSIVDAQTDTVTDVINLGNLSSSSINIADIHMDMGNGTTMNHVKVLVPSRQTTASDNEITNYIASVEIDPATGTQVAGSSVQYIAVEKGPAHRNGKTSHDGLFAYYPNGGDCGATPAEQGPGCHLISIIDVMSEQVVGEMHTEGHEPGSITVISATELTAIGNTGGTGGGGHVH
ncbi:MAG: hypothetical protein OEZ68_01745 [Gammaproteobacteria bacterium]|nr:hypothetical protein [Gammaproteobacteria bacterium]MDH5799503.1 hypothetical protein [Gammaproteobacteria bacterium]